MITFDAQKHAYTNVYTGEEYISVTTLLNKYKKPFDAKAAAERVAVREGTTPEEIQKKWKQINTDSKNHGTKIHAIVEGYIKDKIIAEGYESLINSYENLGIIEKTDEILSEEKLYSHQHKLAGTADIIRIETRGGFSIFDIKTNKKFNFYSQYNEKMLRPIEHLSSCEYNLYSLQLSLYAFMYQELTGRNVNQLGIFYYKDNAFSYFPTTYMKSDIKKILEHYEKSQLG
jgi:hypothetical protein